MFLISVDPCEPNPCGAGAKCVSDKGNALCSCPVGKTGNPLGRCGKDLKYIEGFFSGHLSNFLFLY